MFKRILAAVICVFAVGTLFSCSEDNDTVVSKFIISKKTEKETEEKDKENEKEKYDEAHADEADIDVINLNNSMYYVFKDTSGEEPKEKIVDINGNTVLEEGKYIDIGWCPEHEVVYASDIYGSDVIPDLEGLVFDANHGGHDGAGYFTYMYQREDGKYYSLSYRLGEVEVSECCSPRALWPYMVYTGKYVELDEYGYALVLYDEEYSDLYSTGNYEYRCITNSGEIMDIGKCTDIQQCFVNGYLYMCRDGKYGYINEEGTCVTGFVFDDATPAYDGRAWVKKDGSWKVVELEESCIISDKYVFDYISSIEGSRYYKFTVNTSETYSWGYPVYSTGIIDIDGNIIIDTGYYSGLGYCDWHDRIWASSITGVTPDYIPTLEGFSFEPDSCGHGGGGYMNYMLHVESGEFWQLYGSENGISAERVTSVPKLHPYSIYSNPEGFPYDYDDYAYADYDAIMELEEQIYSGVFEYAFIAEDGDTVELGECSFVPYSFTNGYLACCNDEGKYGFIDVYGNTAAEFIYDDAASAYDGRAWVKKDGIWTVISVD